MIRIALRSGSDDTLRPPALAESDRTIPDFRLVGDRWEIAADWGGWVASYKRAFESMEGTGLEVPRRLYDGSAQPARLCRATLRCLASMRRGWRVRTARRAPHGATNRV